MATTKTVVVQLGNFNRVIQFGSGDSGGATDHDLLLKEVRTAYKERIGPKDSLTLQIRDKEWDGMFVDFFGDDVEDRSIFRIVLEV